MASSRWKRFAFFDRSTLNLPSVVLDDLVGSSSNISASGRRVSSHQTNDSNQPTLHLQVTCASLPALQEPEGNVPKDNPNDDNNNNEPLQAMWASLNACHEPTTSSSNKEGDETLVLPSQQQQGRFPLTPITSSNSSPGLVLLWVASPDTHYVHCIDVTVRCRSSPTTSNSATSDTTNNIDLDGWRGCVANSGNSKIVDLCARSVGNRLVVGALSSHDLQLHVDPHLHLSARLPLDNDTTPPRGTTIALRTPWNEGSHGRACVLDLLEEKVAVGTDTGVVLVYSYNIEDSSIKLDLTIPAPRSRASRVSVTNLQWSSSTALFCSYNYGKSGTSQTRSSSTQTTTTSSGSSGICCFELSEGSTCAVTARHDLDGRPVLNASLCDRLLLPDSTNNNMMVARPDGLYTYSTTQKVSVSPIEGTKHCACASGLYTLVCSLDHKSGRDAVDVYDAPHKLVAFHVLLSPGHKAIKAVGLRFSQRSTAIVLTSGGSIVTLTEKGIQEKVSLLVQKNLYAAAISMAYADSSYAPEGITALYQRHAEHLYRKGDYSGAMEQYMCTIGSLESSHVIFRYLDAPKIPLLTKYLETLRDRDLATPVHNELLRTCYLKLNDLQAAESIAAVPPTTMAADNNDDAAAAQHLSSSRSLVASLSHNPQEALATVCALEAPQAAQALVVHGPALARVLPKETAGLVVALCVGTYSPANLTQINSKTPPSEVNRLLEYAAETDERACDPYPVHLFAPAFLEHPKMLRLLLAHCNRNKCFLTPSLRRTLLELTLDEWNAAKRTGDTEAEKLRRKEAIAALTDVHASDIGDYEALVIVQLAGFAEGELLLYERLQMTPMLLARYAQDGGDRARRHMLAMCRSDPEVLADVLGHFVAIASERIKQGGPEDDDSTNSEEEDILDDIREALSLAKSQGVLPPVRIARILAGEGAGQFSVDAHMPVSQKQHTVPLSVALDYVGAILDDSRKDISRLKAEVEEYNQLCNSMQSEVDALVAATMPASTALEQESNQASQINIDEMYAKLRDATEEGSIIDSRSEQAREAFWREMNQSEDRFETIARFFAKGVIQ